MTTYIRTSKFVHLKAYSALTGSACPGQFSYIRMAQLDTPQLGSCLSFQALSHVSVPQESRIWSLVQGFRGKAFIGGLKVGTQGECKPLMVLGSRVHFGGEHGPVPLSHFGCSFFIAIRRLRLRFLEGPHIYVCMYVCMYIYITIQDSSVKPQ